MSPTVAPRLVNRPKQAPVWTPGYYFVHPYQVITPLLVNDVVIVTNKMKLILIVSKEL